jgi:hypothetical protein
MDSIDNSSFNTPKRKRWPPAVSTIPPTPPRSSPPPGISLNTNGSLLGTPDDEEAHGSPRTRVAYNFQGLQLEERDEVTQFKLDMPSQSRLPLYKESMEEEDPHREEEVVRKRIKLLKARNDSRTEIPETPDARKLIREETHINFSVVIEPPEGDKPASVEQAKGAALKAPVDSIVFKGSKVTKFKGVGDLKRAYPSINRLSDSKSRSKKRSGTPPSSTSAGTREEEADSHIVDPERAALTWHDDEITGHDPNDPDDDGEGINGIGFKPTSAEAYARSQRRRQQMAEYKNREAREARKNRIERRRGSDKDISVKEAENARKVRFMETGMEVVTST